MYVKISNIVLDFRRETIHKYEITNHVEAQM